MVLPINGRREDAVTVHAIELDQSELVVGFLVRNSLGWSETFGEDAPRAFTKALEMAAWDLKATRQRY